MVLLNFCSETIIIKFQILNFTLQKQIKLLKNFDTKKMDHKEAPISIIKKKNKKPVKYQLNLFELQSFI